MLGTEEACVHCDVCARVHVRHERTAQSVLQGSEPFNFQGKWKTLTVKEMRI